MLTFLTPIYGGVTWRMQITYLLTEAKGNKLRKKFNKIMIFCFLVVAIYRIIHGYFHNDLS